jgi:hypothetical protein
MARSRDGASSHSPRLQICASTTLPSFPASRSASNLPTSQPALSASSSPALQPSLKRRRSEDLQDGAVVPDLTILSSTSRSGRSKQGARNRFFDALQSGSEFPGSSRAINGPDDMTKAELYKCFDILHACGKTAGIEETSLTTTRQSVDSFLEAIFADWTGQMTVSDEGPDLEIQAEADAIVGRVCSKTAPRSSILASLSSSDPHTYSVIARSVSQPTWQHRCLHSCSNLHC